MSVSDGLNEAGKHFLGQGPEEAPKPMTEEALIEQFVSGMLEIYKDEPMDGDGIDDVLMRLRCDLERVMGEIEEDANE